MHSHLGLIGGAGVGKSTAARVAVTDWSYHRHALADPMKVREGWTTFLQCNQRVPYDPDFPHLAAEPATLFDAVQRIMTGRMGYLRGAKSVNLETYRQDVMIKDFFVTFVNDHKKVYRTPLQHWGTEVVRHFAKVWDNVPDEPWVAILQQEVQTSASLSSATVCDDVRHPHEASLLTPDGFVFVRVERRDAEGAGMNATNKTHSSEQHWREIPAHYRLVNNGTVDDLAGAIRSIIYHQHAIGGAVYEAQPAMLYHAHGCELHVTGEIPVWNEGRGGRRAA